VLSHTTHKWALRISEIVLGHRLKPITKFQQFRTKFCRNISPYHITFLAKNHITSNSSRTLFIYRCKVETVKLNFHLELNATLDCNLNSGLCLELQVWCALVSHKVLTDTGLPQGFPAVWRLYVILHGLS
jgi:hypothetical protein